MKKLKINFKHPIFSAELIENSIVEILEANTLLSMATVTPDNKAWIATAYYSFTENLELFIITPKNNVHSHNIKSNNSVALSIFDSHQEGSDLKRGLQLFGNIIEAKGIILVKGIFSYSNRFPWLKDYIKKPSDFLKGVISSRLFVMQIRKVKIFDEKTFGEETWVEVQTH